MNLRPVPPRIVDFDHRVTAPLCGFRDVWDYYRRASSAPRLARMALPSLIVTARDDSVVPITMFEQGRYSPSTQLVITRQRGHVAFFGRRGADADRWWIDWRIVDWVTWLPRRTTVASLRGSAACEPTAC